MIELEDMIRKMGEKVTGGLLLELAQLAVWVVVILIAVWLVRKGVNRAVADHLMRYRIKKGVRLAGYALIILLAIGSFTGNLQYFTVAIGLMSAGIAFALQEVILSVAGWFAIYGSNYYKAGDRIEMNGVKGDVIDISVTKTTLMEIGEWVKDDNYSGRIVQISNSNVFKGSVFNYSADFPFVWDEILIPVKFGSDVAEARKIFLGTARNALSEYAEFARDHWKQMVRKYLIENSNVEPMLTLQLTDNWMAFTLRYVIDYKKRRLTKDRIFSDIYRAIEQSEGKVELASTTMGITEWPPIQVDLRNKGT